MTRKLGCGGGTQWTTYLGALAQLASLAPIEFVLGCFGGWIRNPSFRDDVDSFDDGNVDLDAFAERRGILRHSHTRYRSFDLADALEAPPRRHKAQPVLPAPVPKMPSKVRELILKHQQSYKGEGMYYLPYPPAWQAEGKPDYGGPVVAGYYPAGMNPASRHRSVPCQQPADETGRKSHHHSHEAVAGRTGAPGGGSTHRQYHHHQRSSRSTSRSHPHSSSTNTSCPHPSGSSSRHKRGGHKVCDDCLNRLVHDRR